MLLLRFLHLYCIWLLQKPHFPCCLLSELGLSQGEARRNALPLKSFTRNVLEGRVARVVFVDVAFFFFFPSLFGNSTSTSVRQ